MNRSNHRSPHRTPQRSSNRQPNRSVLAFRRYMLFFLAATAAILAYFWLAYREPVPAWAEGTAADPRSFLSVADAERASSYSMLRDSLYFVGTLWEWGMLLWLLTSGYARTLSQRLKAAVPSVVVRFPLYIAGISAALFALGLPLRLLSYSIARNYDVSTLSFGGWWRDQWVQLGVDTVLLLAVGAVVFALARKGGTWWFRLWLLSIPFLLFMMVIRPLAIDPLFYKYEPLADPALEHAVLEMTSKAGVPTDRVYEANYSEKTNAINAYVDGFGPSLRIVIWDTALQKLTADEIVVLTAHEVAHYVKHHLQWSAVGGVASMFLLLWIGNKAYRAILKRWRAFLFVRHPADWAGLPLMLLVVSVLSFAATPISSAVSRHAELEADRFAYALTGDADAAVTLYQKLASSSRAAVHPPALTYWFRYTHPSLGSRIAEALRYERELP
ncbi:M48 family metallopeptidase [Paenibacillus sp.]|uniref:M48 family metallopeptidase n=1 Tax=Paenibacillus sp. TaxID=58172 RepID=UPI002D34A05A|nr:M48 family metallopeptidase [Paenibacillus sp.]HZG56984.1 M48 family metallopeptidase [Paenibacillus sp.]